MDLSPAQKTTFQTWLANNASSLSDDAAAVLANTIASPSYLVWKRSETRINVQAATAFDWTRVDNLSVGKARIWDWMFNQVDYIEPWRGNFRTGINAVWVGTAADLLVRDAVNGACQRSVTNFEKLFVVATTTGPTQTGSRGAATNADTLGLGVAGNFIEGPVSGQDVSNIRAGV